MNYAYQGFLFRKGNTIPNCVSISECQPFRGIWKLFSMTFEKFQKLHKTLFKEPTKIVFYKNFRLLVWLFFDSMIENFAYHTKTHIFHFSESYFFVFSSGDAMKLWLNLCKYYLLIRFLFISSMNLSQKSVILASLLLKFSQFAYLSKVLICFLFVFLSIGESIVS